MKFQTLLAGMLALAPTFATQNAFSTTFSWTYTVDGVTASGTLQATADPSASIAGSDPLIVVPEGAYDVTSISGFRDGVAITGLASAYGQDQLIFTPTANLFDVAAVVDWNGLAYTTAGGASYDLYYFPFSSGIWACSAGASYCEANAGGLFFASNVSISETGVPEPASWALMLVGFSGLGFLGYRARKTAAIAPLVPLV